MSNSFIHIVLLFLVLVKLENCEKLPPPCDSEIFCHGRIIDIVMRQHIFKDSKTYVDLKLKKAPNETLRIFDEFMESVSNKPNKSQLLNWVEMNFDKAGSELELHAPKDHKKDFQLLHRLKDDNLRKFASDLNNIWIELCRKMKDEVKQNPELTSIIYVPNPFIIAGGRFLEIYYWDSYWIIRGLLVSEMYETARGIIENFISVIDRLGFIPNGGRVYYKSRSHPPLLAPMIKSYFDATDDINFAISSIRALENEFAFFMNKTVIVNGRRLARYIERSSGPRPESYREDLENAEEGFKTDEERQEFYSNMKAGAESGMDFSSRWFINSTGGNVGTLRDIKAKSIIAVDLNAFLYWSAKIISEFNGYAGRGDKQKEYEDKANEIKESIEKVLWNEEDGIWFDFDLINNKSRPYFTPSNFAPLFVNCFDKSKKEIIAEKVLKYIEKNELDRYPGGVPNTLMNTGEQWDFPNVWAPLQYLTIYALENLETKKTSDLALKWAERWVKSNYKAFNDTGAMYEKYVATEFGVSGSGGEYEVQKGFGWSNGAVLDLLNRYGERFSTTDNIQGDASRINFFIMFLPLSFAVVFTF